MARLVAIPMGLLGCGVLFFLCISVSAIGLFLQSLSVLNGETVVAEVIMSPIQSNSQGDYIDIEFTPFIYQSALSEIFSPADPNDLQNIGQTQSYRLYGDTIGVEGPFIKLHDGLLFLNYSNIYKLTLLEGEYRLPENSNASEGTEIILNGGYDASWWDFNGQVATAPYNNVVERFTFEGAREPGFRGTGKRKYQIVATFDTLTWNLVANIAG
jgi:hypothetical protein